VPRVRVEDYEDFEDDNMSLDIQEDDPRDRHGNKIPPRPPKQDRDWEENRKALIQRKLGRDRD